MCWPTPLARPNKTSPAHRGPAQAADRRRVPYLFLNGLWFKRSWGRKVENAFILVAISVNQDGFREVFGSGRTDQTRKGLLAGSPSLSQRSRTKGRPTRDKRSFSRYSRELGDVLSGGGGPKLCRAFQPQGMVLRPLDQGQRCRNHDRGHPSERRLRGHKH